MWGIFYIRQHTQKHIDFIPVFDKIYIVAGDASDGALELPTLYVRDYEKSPTLLRLEVCEYKRINTAIL